MNHEIFPDGSDRWTLNCKLHRYYGPIVIWNNGSQEWLINDLESRFNDPAVILADGEEG